jgi:hypothetical protein
MNETKRVDAVPVVDATPIGKSKYVALSSWDSHPHTWKKIEFNEYAPYPDGKRLRDCRRGLGVTLRDAARELGLRPSEVSGLERGSKVLDRGIDMDHVIAVLFTVFLEGKR